MKLFLRNIKIILIIFLILSVSLLAGLFVQQHRSVTMLLTEVGENKSAMRSRYQNAGDILSRDGVLLAHSAGGERLYAEDAELARAFLQIVGDYTHHMTNTVENLYQGTLLGTDRNLFKQLYYDLLGKGLRGDNLKLTLDSRLNLKALELLGERKGAIVLLNYTTGEVLAAVSTPTSSPENAIAFDHLPETSLFNRALQGAYFPASTFKVLTSAAWLESPLYDPALLVSCDSPHPLIEPDGVREDNERTHGEGDLTTAFGTSCNYFFGTLGIKMGEKHLIKTAEQFGFNEKLSLGRLRVATPTLVAPSRSDALLSWLAIGQPQGDNELTVSPLYLAMVAGAVANNGLMMQPQLILSKSDTAGKVYEPLKAEDLRQAMPPEVAAELRRIMIHNVEENYAEEVAMSGYQVGGKTGTAEVAGQQANNRLMLAFLNSQEGPYAACVILEDSKQPASELIRPLFRAALEYKP